MNRPASTGPGGGGAGTPYPRRYHLPESLPRPVGLSPDTARLLGIAVRQALDDAVRAAEARRNASETLTGPASGSGGRGSASGEQAVGAYPVPSYDDRGSPVALPLVRASGQGGGPVTAGRPAGGIGASAAPAGGGRDLGRGAGTRPAPTPAPPRAWTPQALEALRARMGHGYRDAVIGRISADSLVVGGQSIRLVPALGDGADRERTVAARIGDGAFYLDPIPRDRFRLLAAAVPGAGYAVQRVGADGRRQDTGLRVLTWNTATVPAGILAYTSGLTTLREITVVGRRPGDPRAAAARIADVLHHLTQAPGSVAAVTLKAYLRDLDDDEVMACFEELRKLGRLGETLALVRVREFRAYLKERHVPWSYIFANWEPNLADGAAVFSGVLWGAGESVTDVLEIIGMLAGSVFSERLAQERHQFWTAVVTAVQNPLITGQEGLRQLRDTFWERLAQLEFFDAGRFLGQLVVAVMTLPEAVRALPKLGRSAVRVVAAFNRIGVAVLDRIGLTLRDMVRFLLTEQRAFVTDNNVVLMMSGGDDILASGPKVKGTVAIAHGEVVQAVKGGTALFSDAEIDAWLKRLDELLKQPAKSGATGAGAAGKAVLTVEALEELVGAALAELGEAPGSATLPNSVKGTKLHTIFSRLVKERFAVSGLELVSETSLRSFAKLPAELLDLPIETYVKRTPGLMPYERELTPLFRGEGGKLRLIGDLTPDLVVRAPGELVVFDLTSVERARHLAKDILYTHLLSASGEIARVGETYWRHFGRTTAEIESLYPKEVRAARKQAELARRLKALHDAKKGTSP
ncbi:hypothetical protein ACIOHE_04865 [Streptomyces sp. NPDC087851]|uniref:hypothetical protein n=1 Tax=Streptomyces sp. NPDC087851 TaxID=3365810 RepID=UPI0037F34724